MNLFELHLLATLRISDVTLMLYEKVKRHGANLPWSPKVYFDQITVVYHHNLLPYLERFIPSLYVRLFECQECRRCEVSILTSCSYLPDNSFVTMATCNRPMAFLVEFDRRMDYRR